MQIEVLPLILMPTLESRRELCSVRLLLRGNKSTLVPVMKMQASEFVILNLMCLAVAITILFETVELGGRSGDPSGIRLREK